MYFCFITKYQFNEIKSMAGVEEKLGREVYISDETEGIIPRSFRLFK